MGAFEEIEDKNEGKIYNKIKRQPMHELMILNDHELMIDCVHSVLSWALRDRAG